jgi:hypothetical protein
VSGRELFISHAGQVEGPLSAAEIRKKLGKSEISYVDHLWDPQQDSWVLVAAYFAGDFPPPKEAPAGVRRKPKKPELKAVKDVHFESDSGISNEPIWFLFREQQKLGPYRYLEVVSFLQQKSCGPDDFIWKPSFSDWQKIRSCADFSEPVLKKLANVKDIPEKVFIERRFPRVPYDSEVILHDDAHVVFGAAKSLSEGGAFVEVPKVLHQKGDRLKLHFTPGDLRAPFNCIAEVTQVSKAAPIGYNVKFIYLEEEDRERIADFAKATAGKK